MFSQTTIVGRITRDPESKYTASGVPFAKFSVAVDQDFKDKETGHRETDFFDCVTWRGTAEFVAKYLAKGRLVVVMGRMCCRHVTKDDGTKRTYWNLNVERVHALDRPRDGAPGDVPPTSETDGTEADDDPYGGE